MSVSKNYKQVVVRCEVNPELADRFVSLSKKFIKGVRAEEGCISSNLIRSSHGEAVFLHVGIWQDQEALEAHMHSKHFHKYVPQLGECVLQMQTDICDIEI